MRFLALPPAQACGHVLAHSIAVEGRRLAKGRVLDRQDCAALEAAGVAQVDMACADPGDVGEDEAASRIAQAVAGSGITVAAPVHGRVNLIAGRDGLVTFDSEQLTALNRISDAVTLATVQPAARVRAGQIIATIKIIPYLVPGAILDSIEARAACPIAVEAFKPMRTALIQTCAPGSNPASADKTTQVTARRLQALGSTITMQATLPHDAAALAQALRNLRLVDLILIAGASAITDVLDVVPRAIVAAGGRIERLGMPVDPGNLLCLAELAHVPVIGLPGCARSPKRNGLDLVLERLAAGLGATSADIAAMGIGGLLDDTPARPEPRAPTNTAGPVGLILLAAGRSTRMGGPQKLLADLHGKPVVRHSAEHALAAGVAGVHVVTGDAGDSVAAALGDLPLQLHPSPDSASGLSASLRTGLLAVPSDWSAAIIALGDMPSVPASVHDALIAAHRAHPGRPCVPVNDGRRGNPVLWPRSYWPDLMNIEGDIGARALLAALGETVLGVDVSSDAILRDIDTPADLEQFRNQT